MRMRGLGRRISLENAAIEENLSYSGTAHNAESDCIMVADLVNKLVKENLTVLPKGSILHDENTVVGRSS